MASYQAVEQLRSSVDVGFEVGLRRALFDGTIPASLRSLALQMMASTGGQELLINLDSFHFNSNASPRLVSG